MSHHCRTLQKSIPVAAVKKRHNRPYVQQRSQKMPQYATYGQSKCQGIKLESKYRTKSMKKGNILNEV